jgi:hypothetical protein
VRPADCDEQQVADLDDDHHVGGDLGCDMIEEEEGCQGYQSSVEDDGHVYAHFTMFSEVCADV